MTVEVKAKQMMYSEYHRKRKEGMKPLSNKQYQARTIEIVKMLKEENEYEHLKCLPT